MCITILVVGEPIGRTTQLVEVAAELLEFSRLYIYIILPLAIETYEPDTCETCGNRSTGVAEAERAVDEVTVPERPGDPDHWQLIPEVETADHGAGPDRYTEEKTIDLSSVRCHQRPRSPSPALPGTRSLCKANTAKRTNMASQGSKTMNL